jgi:hypothetical protein
VQSAHHRFRKILWPDLARQATNLLGPQSSPRPIKDAFFNLGSLG